MNLSVIYHLLTYLIHLAPSKSFKSSLRINENLNEEKSRFSCNISEMNLQKYQTRPSKYKNLVMQRFFVSYNGKVIKCMFKVKSI